MRDDDDDDKQLKIELLSQWKLEAEFRNSGILEFSTCITTMQDCRRHSVYP